MQDFQASSRSSQHMHRLHLDALDVYSKCKHATLEQSNRSFTSRDLATWTRLAEPKTRYFTSSGTAHIYRRTGHSSTAMRVDLSFSRSLTNQDADYPGVCITSTQLFVLLCYFHLLDRMSSRIVSTRTKQANNHIKVQLDARQCGGFGPNAPV